MPTPIRLVAAGSLTLSLLTMTPPRAEAGPPAICHQFNTGGAPSLPWAEGSGWRRTVATYDLQRLTDDTLRLLTPTTPVLARMETIRRATIYASTDARVASELLSRVLGRAIDGVASGPANRPALFDAGYLVESYRQANLIYKYEMLSGAEKSAWQLRETPKGLDGYSWITSALAMGPTDPEMEFGASRVTEGPTSQAHVRKALSAARAGTPLAANLVAFGYQPAQAAKR
ncbi:MAG: hypothetical protein JJE40_15320 [Vicinamibacteria bacterium]|nr:hypothetical protein [Vicinamibacteria bacterium]